MYEKLVYAMSTKGTLKMDQFYQLFRMVYFPSLAENEEISEIDIRRQIIRILDSLGYCEFDFDSRIVFMCEPALILLPVFGLPKTLLVGARTPSLVQNIKMAVKKRHNKARFIYSSQGGTDIPIPSSLIIEATCIETVQDIAQEAGITCDVEGPAAWDLANISTSLDDIKKSLVFTGRHEPNWKRRIFVESKLSFSAYHELTNEGYVLAEYKNPVDQQLRHWIWDGSLAAETTRDWGRYIVLADKNVNILMYDEKLHSLAVPATVPLPCLLARAAALSSGTPPSHAVVGSDNLPVPMGLSVHLYSGVPPFIASLIAHKLCQKLACKSFELYKRGMLYA